MEFKVKQIPVITHDLQKVGASVSERLEALNIEKQVATSETVATLKKLRAELNKEVKDLELQRKTVKDAVMKPYSEFEAIYKEEALDKYKKAEAMLKEKITAFEEQVKNETTTEMKSYFEELCLAEEIDFLTWDNLGITCKLSDSKKSIKDKINAFVDKVKDELALIDIQEHKAEIIVEYKKTLNAALAIKSVIDRKEAEKAEKERLRLIEVRRRQSILRNFPMVYHDITRTYNWVTDESVMIKHSDLENLSVDDFNKLIVGIELTINEKKAANNPVEQAEQKVAPKVEPLKAPVKEEKPTPKEELLQAVFEVEGTYDQLMKLSEFLKSNNITYKNL